MNSAILIAKILGPTYLIIGLGILRNGALLSAVIRDFAESPALLYLSGVLSLLIGTWIVRIHSAWNADWTLVITLLGWIAIIRGAVRLLAPEWSQATMLASAERSPLIQIAGAAALVLGGILTAGGYGWLG